MASIVGVDGSLNFLKPDQTIDPISYAYWYTYAIIDKIYTKGTSQNAFNTTTNTTGMVKKAFLRSLTQDWCFLFYIQSLLATGLTRL